MLKAFMELREIQQVFEDAAEVLEEDIGTPICLPSCGLCCQHNLPMWKTIEAIHAVSVLTGTGRIKQAVGIAENWLLDKHKEATLYEGMPVGFASPKLREEWHLMAQSRCPFLMDDMSCFIHDVRPLVCRAFNVTRDGSEICPRPLGKGEDQTHRRYIPASILKQKIQEWEEKCRRKNKSWLIAGFIPTTFFRAAKERKFRDYVHDNRIASAKLIGTEMDTSLMWQPQLDALRSGISPDLVAAGRNVEDWSKVAQFKPAY